MTSPVDNHLILALRRWELKPGIALVISECVLAIPATFEVEGRIAECPRGIYDNECARRIGSAVKNLHSDFDRVLCNSLKKVIVCDDRVPTRDSEPSCELGLGMRREREQLAIPPFVAQDSELAEAGA